MTRLAPFLYLIHIPACVLNGTGRLLGEVHHAWVFQSSSGKTGTDGSEPVRNLHPVRHFFGSKLTGPTAIEIDEGIASAEIIGTNSASLQSRE
jgi:hypothetical protein